jgi:hypothetical protein
MQKADGFWEAQGGGHRSMAFRGSDGRRWRREVNANSPERQIFYTIAKL